MTIQAFIRAAQHPESLFLLRCVWGITETQLSQLPMTTEIPEKVYTNALRLCEKRKQGYPAAYLVGEKSFYRDIFMVNPSVLIPRPESEWLVEQCLQAIQSIKSVRSSAEPITVLDIGCGSGCIGLSILKYSDSSSLQLTLSDISKQALEIARKNADKILPDSSLNRINYIESDLFQTVPKQKFSFITANLPYIPVNRMAALAAEVLHEPHTALTSGDTVGLLYKKFFETVTPYLAAHYTLFFEIDPSLVTYVTEYISLSLPQSTFSFHRDYQNLKRYVLVQGKA